MGSAGHRRNFSGSPEYFGDEIVQAAGEVVLERKLLVMRRNKTYPLADQLAIELEHQIRFPQEDAVGQREVAWGCAIGVYTTERVFQGNGRRLLRIGPMQALKNARPPATPRGIRLAVVMIEMGIENNFRGAGEPF